MWITEIGWPTTQVGPLGQAQAVARGFLNAAARPDLYERYFVYDFLCDGTDPDEMEHNFGLVEQDLSIRPAYVALSVASRFLAGKSVVKQMQSPDDSVRLYCFSDGKKHSYVGWVMETGLKENIEKTESTPPAGSTPDRTMAVTLHVDAPEVLITNWQGQQRTQTTANGDLALALTTWPTYIDLP